MDVIWPGSWAGLLWIGCCRVLVIVRDTAASRLAGGGDGYGGGGIAQR